MTLAVLLAHGSPDPRSSQAVAAAAARVSELFGSRVVPAYLDHDVPSLADVVASAVGDEDVRVLPLLLSSAFHARVDVPAAIAALPRPVTLLAPLGHPAAALDAALQRAGQRCVVVAAGTSVAEERAAFAAAVAASSLRTGVEASAAFATGAGPRLTEALADAAVVPWLLGPGRLLDSVLADADAHGRPVVGGPLLQDDVVLSAIAQLLAETGTPHRE